MDKHTKVRGIVGESGTMITAGFKMDFASSSGKRFMGTFAENLSDHSRDMNEIIFSAMCQNTLNNAPCWSREIKNCPWFKTEDSGKVLVLPWVLI